MRNLLPHLKREDECNAANAITDHNLNASLNGLATFTESELKTA